MPENERWEEEMLDDLARALVFPAAPDLRASVLARLEAPAGVPRLPYRRLALAAAATVIVVSLVVAAASRDAREAIADWLGLAVEGERIEVLPTAAPGMTSTPVPTPLSPVVALESVAERITRTEAERRIGRPMVLPASLGEPPSYFVVRDGIPVVVADYGQVQVWEFSYEGDVFIGKGIVGGGTVVRELQVDGHPAYWVAGGSRIVTVVEAGTPRAGTQRTVTANALIWSANGLYRRIEGASTLEAALALAGEMP